MPDPLSLDALAGRVDSFLLNRMASRQGAFSVEDSPVKPTWNRFDLGFKLLYLDALRTQMTTFAQRIYAAHIHAFSLGDMREPGAQEKSGIDRFESEFQAIFESIRDKGFDTSQSLVPLASDGSILNAAHRCASALALGKEVTTVQTGLTPMVFDHTFFRDRNVDEADLEAAATRLIHSLPHAAVALLWPAASGKLRAVENEIGPLIYKRELSLSLEAGHNLLARVYADEPWLGAPEEHYPGIRRKLLECFTGNSPLRVLIFDAPPDVDRIALKDRIRAIYGIAKSSVHITDTHAEAIDIARLLFNANSRHFLEHARPNAFVQTQNHVADMAGYLSRTGKRPEDVAFDTGMVLGAYGLRAPGDADVIAVDPLPGAPAEVHDGKHRSIAPAEILQDPARHFSYFGQTFVALHEVAALKKVRLAGQDREDLLLMEPLLQSSGARRSGPSVSMRVRMHYLRIRRFGIKLLFRLGVGAPLRTVYRAIKGRR